MIKFLVIFDRGPFLDSWTLVSRESDKGKSDRSTSQNVEGDVVKDVVKVLTFYEVFWQFFLLKTSLFLNRFWRGFELGLPSSMLLEGLERYGTGDPVGIGREMWV